MSKTLRITFIILIVLLIGFISGPRVSKPQVNTELTPFQGSLDEAVEVIQRDSIENETRPGNASKFIWYNDSLKNKTEYVLVYLHGFSASPEEGNPAHYYFANRYGMNLYIPRLFEHGLKKDIPLKNFTGEGFINSAKEAIAKAKVLGDKVIIMACSTGATAGLYIASGNPDIHALICYSPNVDLYDKTSNIITMPWGVQLSKMVIGGDIYHWDADSIRQQYWYTDYAVESIAEMKAMLQTTMVTEVFNKIEQPLFMGYYYKNEKEQDNTVSVEKMKEMFNQLATPKTLKRRVAFPNVANHAIQNKYSSNDYEAVLQETYRFAEEILDLKPIE